MLSLYNSRQKGEGDHEIWSHQEVGPWSHCLDVLFSCPFAHKPIANEDSKCMCQSRQIKSNRNKSVKSSQVKSSQVKSSQVKSGQLKSKSNQITTICWIWQINSSSWTICLYAMNTINYDRNGLQCSVSTSKVVYKAISYCRN